MHWLRISKFIYYKEFLAICIFLFGFLIANSQTNDYAFQMRELSKNIDKYFYIPNTNYYKENATPLPADKKVSYLWPLCAMFEAANEAGRITNNYAPFENIFSIITKYHNDLPPAPGYASYSEEFGGGTRFYDDNQWIGITAMDAYERTKNAKWLKVGKEIYRFMMTGYDTVSGGGLYWEEGNKKTKNTCSNGPGIILAMQLYKATKEKMYLDTALLLYAWVNKYLRTPEGLYQDNLRTRNFTVDKRIYSYNSGTMLQSNVYLYEATGNKKYLDEAIRIAESSAKHFYGEGMFRDNHWFNAVLLRGYQHLLKYNKDIKYITIFKVAVDNAIQNDRSIRGLMGLHKEENLVGQGGMLEILARFAWLQKNKIIQ